MRVSTTQVFESGLNNMLDQQALLSRVQEQLSTGKKINRPADDPTGAARVLDLTQVRNQNEQFDNNITLARNRLQLEESVFASLENAMHRLRELAVQGNNDTLSNSDREMVAAEARDILDEIYGLANTVDANGEYLFAGFQSLNRPFSRNADGTALFSGDQGQRFLQIGPNAQVPVNDSGAEVFMRILDGNGKVAAAANGGNLGTGVISTPLITDPASYFGQTFDVVTTALAPATADGGATVGLFTDTGVNDTLSYELRVNGTLVYTQGEADTPLATVADVAAQINTQSATTGVRAEADANGQLHLYNEPQSTQSIRVDEALLGASEAADSFTSYFGANLSGAQPAGSATFTAADGHLAFDGTGALVAGGAFVPGSALTVSGVQFNIDAAPQPGDRFTVRPSENTNLFDLVLDFAQLMEQGAADSAERALLHDDMNRVLENLAQAQDHLLVIRAQLGGRLKKLDLQQEANADFNLQIDTTISAIQDVDFAKVISDFQQQLVSLQAAQSSFAKIQGLSLFNYI